MGLRSLHHARFAVSDLDKAEQFAADFGLKKAARSDDILYMRTSGGDAYSYVAERGERGFRSVGFTVDSRDDLERAVREHNATSIAALDGPGGGEYVSLLSPEGLRFDLLHGIEESQGEAPPPPLALNSAGAVTREHRPQSKRGCGPAHLYRLGHIGLYVRDLKATREWLVHVLGMRVSDDVFIGTPDHVIVSFLRLDRGAELIDHHAVFLVEFQDRSDCHHISFEAQDYEAQFRTHRFLGSRGWNPLWGVGRHEIGSHVFDTWFSPDEYRFETYSDTDKVNDSYESGLHDLAAVELDVWSPESAEKYFA